MLDYTKEQECIISSPWFAVSTERFQRVPLNPKGITERNRKYKVTLAESTAVFLISKPPFNSEVIKDISGVFLLNMNKNQARYFHAHNVQNYSQILLES